MKQGPPRQKITVIYDGKPQEYVIPNSAEDEKMFRAEIRWFNKLDVRLVTFYLFSFFPFFLSSFLPFLFNRAELDIYIQGDVEKTNLKWSKMREGRKYVAELA